MLTVLSKLSLLQTTLHSMSEQGLDVFWCKCSEQNQFWNLNDLTQKLHVRSSGAEHQPYPSVFLTIEADISWDKPSLRVLLPEKAVSSVLCAKLVDYNWLPQYTSQNQCIVVVMLVYCKMVTASPVSQWPLAFAHLIFRLNSLSHGMSPETKSVVIWGGLRAGSQEPGAFCGA